MEPKIDITYCPNNPRRHDSTLFDRLKADDHLTLHAPFCRMVCEQYCVPGFYALVKLDSSMPILVRGVTELEFLDNLEKLTGLDLQKYYSKS